MTTDLSDPQSDKLLSPEEVNRFSHTISSLLSGLETVILGQRDLLEMTVIGVLSQGHLLLEGLPGLGKTELVKALASLLGLQFRRVQFTPDLLPGDILGSPILQEQDGSRALVFHQGPVFTNLLLADEINRATPKTQSALLEAMQERCVTVMGETHSLPSPFFVLATQNPIELEGTYPLPEAQLDRFTFKLDVQSVSSAVLQEIISKRQHGRPPETSVIVSGEDLQSLFQAVDRVHLPQAVSNFIARLVSATHPNRPEAPEECRQFVKYGASPRAAIAMSSTARAAALIAGKPNVGFDDVRRVALPVLRHRLLLDYSARLEGWTPERMAQAIIQSVPDVAREIPEDIEVVST